MSVIPLWELAAEEQDGGGGYSGARRVHVSQCRVDLRSHDDEVGDQRPSVPRGCEMVYVASHRARQVVVDHL